RRRRTVNSDMYATTYLEHHVPRRIPRRLPPQLPGDLPGTGGGGRGCRTPNEAPVRPRTSTEHPQAAVTSRPAALAAGCTALLLALTACAGPSSASDGKNGDTPPAAQSRSESRTQAQAGTARTP